MSAYPVLYEADYIEKRNRLTVFFRAFLALPHVLALTFVGIGMLLAASAAWFALVLTGRYPPGLHAFNVMALRWLARVNAYAYLQVDAYPPFDFDEDPAYPVRMRFAGALPEYSRSRALLRLLLAIPVLVVLAALSVLLQLCAIAVWFVAVILGRVPKALHDGLDLALSYQAKAYAYLMLLTETYPPLSNENATLTPGVVRAAERGGIAPAMSPAAHRPRGLGG